MMDRRTFCQASAVAVAARVAAGAVIGAGKALGAEADAELLELERQWHATCERHDRLADDAAPAEWDAAYVAERAARDALAAYPATTLAGLHIKARAAVLDHGRYYLGGLEHEDGLLRTCGTELFVAIVRDLTAGRAV